MSEHNKLYNLLRLRRRIDRKVLLNQKWTSQYSLRNRVEILLRTQSVYSFVLKDKELYFLLNKKIEKFTRRNKLIKPCPAFQIESVNNCKLIPEWFKILTDYGERLALLGAKLIVQGSYADGEITTYSDVDLVIFYKPFDPGVLKIKKEIDTFLLSIDPLQHHGVFMIDINTFPFYWQMDLPVEVLKKAKYFGEYDVTISISGILLENQGSLNAAQSIINGINTFIRKDYHQIGLWDWKFFISDLLLLPTLLLGSQGNYIYKRESFPVAKKMFSKDAWYCIEKASAIRNVWPESASLEKYKSLRNSVSEKLVKDPTKAVDIIAVSVEKDSKFFGSLKILVEESKSIITND